ncbi:tRNA (adenosine(37)-N6)-threonylcarbamoyltransferase complex dimerization subunit type 1 TsaB [Corynebacterium meitnerae]|uniref:tRNA (Adenosine(37)-N6)-threonylcarbamoyltransferase complex dimerization subunit type 1 TsaB n=1 Tax=Corynebacterium meitnerae TaxID=2913498 RepID=A0A9X3LUG3_9CORY|nr:tRNA (adenosine(37)-N6)-threonylcarbamoyltransferase complex dimerization subunit type 1 TsaB [Corynebacterium meitnerae]MCZ9293894.1 tRNA (adenosine(37)-N6)-threonylcarbamoyltransferase complex dimerization subunit type 1 TsaB [Corynebacterium meitnerae]
MIVLALDTATTDLVAGIVDAQTGDTLAEAVTPTRSHNELLVPTVMELLESARLAFTDIEAIVVGCGPGPFTGLRVGMATASAFGQALGVPVHGVCTHDAVALLMRGSSLILTDARRREVYWARYSDGERVAGPDVIAPGQLEVTPVDVVSVPENLRDKLPEELVSAAGTVTYEAPRAAALVAAARAAVGDLSAPGEPLVPLYLRRPDAKEPAPKPLSPAIPRVSAVEE